MTETLKISVTTNGRTAEFKMTFDPTFPPDHNMRLCLERDKACEPEIVHLMARIIKPGDVVVDGGANVGYFTCLMSQWVGKSGLVYAVEPTPTNIAKLEHNLANNASRNVRVVKTALAGKVEERELHMGFDTGENSLTAHALSVGHMKLVTTTIDAVLDGQAPALIKLDIEGFEHHALQGAAVALAHDPYVVCELNDAALCRAGSSRQSLRDYMEDNGFKTWLLHADGTLPRFIPPNTEIISEKQNLMGLFATTEMVGKAWPEVQLG